ncbi:MAG TPA: NADH-quinone oxidoreductase subunit J, partial [Polyangiaceae bacterium]|nr:NADH-quinone oxidoreductase subunit J [Polyangiaceae bacterium]
MNAGALLFFVCSVACLVGALSTIVAKNPIRGAMGLLTTIVGIAGLFLLLQAQFLAAIQLIVYAGAVVVLFVFVIMLLGPDAGAGTNVVHEPLEPAGRIARGFSTGVVVLMLIGAGVLLALSSEEPTRFLPVSGDHGSVEAVGNLLFTRGLVPFELTTILLIVAAIGAIALARTRPGKKSQVKKASPTRRMFHGPLVARDDTGRPAGTPSSLGKEA